MNLIIGAVIAVGGGMLTESLGYGWSDGFTNAALLANAPFIIAGTYFFHKGLFE
jgi:hypothetical protein